MRLAADLVVPDLAGWKRERLPAVPDRLGGAFLPVKGVGHKERIPGGHPKQRECRAIRCAPTLLPIAQRRHADADHESKFGLGSPQRRTDGLHLGWLKLSDPPRLQRSSPNSTRLTNTGYEFFKGC